MKIEITSSSVHERGGIKNGKDWNIRTQIGYAHIPDENGRPQSYPESISIDLKKDQQPYPSGMYQLSDSSFFKGEYGKLALGRLVLLPMTGQAAPPVRASA